MDYVVRIKVTLFRNMPEAIKSQKIKSYFVLLQG